VQASRFPSSAAKLTDAILAERRADERHQPILVHLHHPHWVFEEFDMTELEEPGLS
jgi:ABC-type proline/glycine betaine transport system substrate-binding protein